MKLGKKGEGYVLTAVLIIVFCMILSSLVTLVNAYNTVKLIKRNTVTVLNGYIMTNAVDIYDSIKQGNDSINGLDGDEYVNRLRKFASLKLAAGNKLAKKDGTGKILFEITRPQIGFITDKRLKVQVSYTVYLPIYFGGMKIGTAEVPVKVNAALTEKY